MWMTPSGSLPQPPLRILVLATVEVEWEGWMSGPVSFQRPRRACFITGAGGGAGLRGVGECEEE